MTVKQPRLGELPVATPQTIPQPDESAATLIRGVGQIAASAAESFGRQEAAEAAQAEEDVLSMLEDDIITDSFSSLVQEAEVAKTQEVEGMELSPTQQRALSDASRQAAQLDALEEQTGQAEDATLRRATIYRQYKARFPELTEELRGFFKQTTGQSVIESLQDIEEDRATSTTEQRKAIHTSLVKTAEGLGFVTAGKTSAELQGMVSPYQDQMVAAATASREAQFLQDNRTIRTEERRVVEEAILESGATGSLINNQLLINDLLKDFDFETADEDTKKALISELQVNKGAFQAQTRGALQVTDPTQVNSLMQPTLDAYDQAILVANGEMDKKLLTTNNAISRESAMLQLNKVPGFSELSAKLQTFRNIPAELVAGGQRVRFSRDQVQPMLEMLSQGMSNPTGNPYGGLASMATPQQLAGQYQKLSQVALSELDNGEAAQNLADTLQAWTNQFTAAPDEVPLGVYGALLDVSSEPGAIEVLNKSPDLGDNLINGYRSFTNRMRAGLAEDLAEMQSERIGVFKPGQVSPVKAGFLGFIVEDYAESFKRPVEAPALFEVLDVQLKGNGDLIFSPIKHPRVQGNAVISSKAKQMTGAYGKTFGKLVRSYAHVVKGNEDYNAAAQELMSFPDWEEALGQVQGTGFGKGEGE